MRPRASSSNPADHLKPGPNYPGSQSLRHPANPTAWHVPHYPVNPYQRLLGEALANRGITVRFRDDPYALAEAQSNADLRGQILHLHWLPKGYLGPRNFLQFARFGVAVQRFRRRGGTVVWTAHNLYTHESRNRGRERRLTRFLIRQLAGVIVHSPRAEPLVRREFAVSPDLPFAVIPHGNFVDYYPATLSRIQARQSLHLSAEHRIAAFAGQIRPYKGVPELARAFRTMPRPSARLVIAGWVADAGIAEAVAAAVQSDPRVIFRPGVIAEEDFQIYLKAADVVAVPYLHVLTSGAAILAMSFGRACVAPLSGCLPDVLAQQPELLYDPTTPGDLDAKLARALDDPGLTQACGDRNAERAAEWTWDEVGRLTAEFYARSLNPGGTAHSNVR